MWPSFRGECDPRPWGMGGFFFGKIGMNGNKSLNIFQKHWGLWSSKPGEFYGFHLQFREVEQLRWKWIWLHLQDQPWALSTSASFSQQKMAITSGLNNPIFMCCHRRTEPLCLKHWRQNPPDASLSCLLSGEPTIFDRKIICKWAIFDN